MKQLLITIAAVVLVGCGESQQSAPALESKPVDPVAEVPAKPPSPVESQPAEPVAEAKAPDISIYEAADDGNIEAVQQHIAAGADVNTKNIRGATPLHYAAANGHKKIAALILAKGASVNAKDVDGTTPLDYAKIIQKYDSPEVEAAIKDTADLLRKHGAKTGLELKAEESIHIAVASGHIEVVKKHLDTGTDVNLRFQERTPLHFAVMEGHKEVAALLIANGADVNAQEEVIGYTPLHRAALSGRREIAELLIAKGADVNTKNSIGRTPLDSAKGETANLLRKHGGKTMKELKAEGKAPDISIHNAAWIGRIEAVKQHIAAGTDVNAKDKNETTPLHSAAARGHKEIVELLIADGADVNAKKKNSPLGTPLDLAIKLRHRETADLLRKHGAKTGEELKAEGK